MRREQGENLESHVNTRQDRNLVLTRGGEWTWDAGTGVVTWSAPIEVLTSGIPVATVAAGTANVGTDEGGCLVLLLDRAVGGSSTVAAVSIHDADTVTDTSIVLAVRGSDGRLYLRDGTVMFDGDSKQLGMLNSLTDRTDKLSDGTAWQTVGFEYKLGKNQLAVYVGGVLQRLGTDYEETTVTTVTFLPPNIPLEGEALTFLNIIGGQGPSAAGSVSLQQAWANDPLIDARGNAAVQILAESGGNALEIGDGSNTYFYVSGVGYVQANKLAVGSWLTQQSSSDLVIGYPNLLGHTGVRVAAAGGLEHGTLASGVWSGGGALRWKVFSGTLSTGTYTDIPVGVDSILGANLAVHDGVTGRWVTCALFTAADSLRALAVSFDAATQTIRVAGNAQGTSGPGTAFDGEAYRLVIFY